MLMNRRLLTVTALVALATPSASALTNSQVRSHVNAVLSNLGAVVTPCPTTVSTDRDSICAEYRSTGSLAMQGWDLYADWSSKVPYVFKHATPWTKLSAGMAAVFEASDGTSYSVGVLDDVSPTYLLIRFDRDANGASAPASTVAAPQASQAPGSPSQLVRDGAPRTRTGPLRPQTDTLPDYGYQGSVREVTERKMTLVTSFGTTQEQLKDTTVRTFDREGRLTQRKVTDAAGKVTYLSAYTYVGDRLTRSEVTEKGETTTTTYEYAANGDLASSTKYDGKGQKMQVVRYTAKPNGYTTETYGPTGGATSRSYALQEPNGEVLESESVSANLTITIKHTYAGGLRTYSRIHSPGTLTTETEYQQGRVTRMNMVGSGVLASASSDTGYRYENFDAKGNPQRQIEGPLTTAFGESKLTPTVITHITYQYY